jgi:PTS system ascorbate-specific IIA component
MIGILIIAHGSLGDTLLQCAAHVLGQPAARTASIAVVGKADPDALLAQARKLIADLDDGSGVLILTDMVGGTPSNVATRALVSGRVEGVSGASLPMVLRALNYRNAPLPAVLAKAISGGQEGVAHLVAEPTVDAASRA